MKNFSYLLLSASWATRTLLTWYVGSLPLMYLGIEKAVFTVMLGMAEVFTILKLKDCLSVLQAWSLHQA